MDVKIVKLVTGELLLAGIQAENDKEVLLDQPMGLMMQPEGLGMAPWLLAADEKAQATISKSHVLVIYETRNELVNAYKEQTGGIVTAKPSLIH